MDYTINPAAAQVVDALFAAAEAVEQFPGQAARTAKRWAPKVQAVVEQIDWAEVATIVGHGLLALMVLTYELGRALGTVVHRANDWLAPRWAGLWVRPEAPDAEPARVVLLLPPAPAPLALLGPAVAPAPEAPTTLADPIATALVLIAQGTSIRAAARQLGIARTTLRRRLQEVAA
jgi:hypothetical protein